jgi:hypothetical protein
MEQKRWVRGLVSVASTLCAMWATAWTFVAVLTAMTGATALALGFIAVGFAGVIAGSAIGWAGRGLDAAPKGFDVLPPSPEQDDVA